MLMRRLREVLKQQEIDFVQDAESHKGSVVDDHNASVRGNKGQ